MTRSLLLWAGIFLLVLGARWGWLGAYGTPLPFWDQWAEAVRIHLPFEQGGLTAESFLARHNDSPVVWTLLFSHLLYRANGHWDPRLEATAAALLPALLAVLLARAGAGRLPGPARPWFCGLVAVLFVAPQAFDSTLNGFCSMWFFLTLFSAATLWGLGLHPPWTGRGAIGAVAALAAPFSLGSGSFAPLAVLILRAIRAALGEGDRREHAAAAGFALGGLVLGFLLYPPLVVEAIPWRARWEGFLLLTSWPFGHASVHGLLVHAPWLALALSVLRRRIASPAGWFALALGGWALLQMAAMAWARNLALAGVPARYMDVLTLGLVADGLALLVLLGEAPRTAGRLALGGWFAAILFSLGHHVVSVSIPEMNAWRDHWRRGIETTRRYLRDGDRAALATVPERDLALPDAKALADLLDDPRLRRMLPAELQIPPALEAEVAEGGFAAAALPPRPGPPPDGPAVSSFGSGEAGDTGRYRSRPLVCDRPLLAIPVAGSHWRKGMRLSVVSEDGSVRRVPVEQDEADTWQTAFIETPPGPFRLEAEDRSNRKWLAFAAPHGTGRFSRLALQALSAGPALAFLGAGLLLLLASLTPRPRDTSG